MSWTPLPNYPQPFGSRKINILQWQGNSNYQQPGDTLPASAMGWGSFDYAWGSYTTNSSAAGAYVAVPLLPVSQATTSTGGANNVTIQYLISSNMAQAANNANLAAEYARIVLIGG